jgi:hypothetical protein
MLVPAVFPVLRKMNRYLCEMIMINFETHTLRLDVSTPDRFRQAVVRVVVVDLVHPRARRRLGPVAGGSALSA